MDLPSDRCALLETADAHILYGQFVTRNGRMAFALQDRALFAIDLFHGKSKLIPSTENFLRSRGTNSIHVLGNDRLLIVNTESPTCLRPRFTHYLTLLAFNAETCTCDVVSESAFDADFEFGHRILLDRSNNDKFALFAYYRHSMRLGQIVDESIVMSATPIEVPDFYIAVLDGEILRALVLDRDSELRLMEHDLNTGNTTYGIQVPRTITMRTGITRHVFPIDSWFWSKKSLYVSRYIQGRGFIFRLDIKQRVWSEVTSVEGMVAQLFVDEEEFLTIRAWKQRTYEFTFYRIPLKKPDSLMNLSWMATRAYRASPGDERYKKIARRIPYNCHLRSFITDE